MFTHNTVITFLLLSVIFVTMVMVAALPKDLILKDRELTDCDLQRDISRICFQCTQNHSREQFSSIYNSCCSNAQSDVRQYCEDIYIEPPRII